MIHFKDAATLGKALLFAQRAHHEYEEGVRKRRNDPSWTDNVWYDWYAKFIASHQEPTSTVSATGELGDYPEGGYGHGV